MKLTLQPIVENSLKHGLELQMGKGRIKFTASKSQDTIRILISDNGKGIPDDKLLELNGLLCKGENSFLEESKDLEKSRAYLSGGLGVKNVNSRLKLHFGNEFGLRFIESQAGTTVEISFPAVERKE